MTIWETLSDVVTFLTSVGLVVSATLNLRSVKRLENAALQLERARRKTDA